VTVDDRSEAEVEGLCRAEAVRRNAGLDAGGGAPGGGRAAARRGVSSPAAHVPLCAARLAAREGIGILAVAHQKLRPSCAEDGR